MKHCNNDVKLMRPKGWDYIEYTLRCGQTGLQGDPVYCGECSARHDKRGHMPYECPHGRDMRPEGAVCSRCEFGE